MSTLYDSFEQWQFAAGRHWSQSPAAACTPDDHDALDPFCGGCGQQLNDAGPCEECAAGDHDGPSPFCPCCGAELQ